MSVAKGLHADEVTAGSTAKMIENIGRQPHAATDADWLRLFERQQQQIDALQALHEPGTPHSWGKPIKRDAEPPAKQPEAVAPRRTFDDFWSYCCVGDEKARHEARLCWNVAALIERERICRDEVPALLEAERERLALMFEMQVSEPCDEAAEWAAELCRKAKL